MIISKSLGTRIALASVAILNTAAAFSQSITVYVDGKPVAFANTTPQKMDGRVLVPLRGVLEEIGADINWNEATQTVKARMGERNLELRLGSRSALVNGQSVALRVPAMRIGGSTMVPLRFIGEALGASVDWSESQQRVSIATGASPGNTRPIVRNQDRENNRDRENNNRPIRNRPFQVWVNGNEESFGAAQPYLRGNEVMVPMAQTARLAILNYRYDSGRNTLAFPDQQLTHAVGSRWMDRNGQRVRLDTTTEMHDGTLYGPLELFQKGWDQGFTWDATTRTIKIVTSPR
jgi:Copper amine oxidase N-terminal domain